VPKDLQMTHKKNHKSVSIYYLSSRNFLI